jgi:tRNA pseudouridine38-40 synthase
LRYFIHLAYDGTNYSGWQVQNNSPTVQGTINAGLVKLLGSAGHSFGCGRTDSGVHAKQFYMHFDSEHELDVENFCFRLNCVLPKDITLFKVIPMPDNAHTRYHAKERTYEYFMHFHKSSFMQKYSLFQGFQKTTDWDLVEQAAAIIPTIEDFTSLCLMSEDFKTNICHIKHAAWDLLPAHHLVLKKYDPADVYAPISTLDTKAMNEPVVRFTITSNRFLRGMVRRIVGTLLAVGRGKISLAEFEDTVRAQKEFKTTHSAPANGLFLSRVVYNNLND